MIDINRLKELIKIKNLNYEDIAVSLNISKNTLNKRFESGIFGSEEIEKLVKLLDIENPVNVFFVENSIPENRINTKHQD